jgi:hypothetical protein
MNITIAKVAILPVGLALAGLLVWAISLVPAG